jgi:DNA-binding response OmpR family regulator
MRASVRCGVEIRIRSQKSGSAITRALFINGKPVETVDKAKVFLNTLLNHYGRVVSYQTLCEHLGYPAPTASPRHSLRQYATTIRTLLDAHNARCVIVVAKDFGYGLCDIAKDSRRPLRR